MSAKRHVAMVAIDRATACGSTSRVFVDQFGKALVAINKQYSKRMLFAQLVGYYNKDCPPEWIEEDITFVLDSFGEICKECGQDVPK